MICHCLMTYSSLLAKHRVWNRRIGPVPYLLILPALLALLALFVYPIAWNVFISLHRVEFTTFAREWPFAGLTNYLELMTDSIFPFRFYRSLWVSLIFVGASVVGQFTLGLGLALALTKLGRIKGLIRALNVFPWILSELVVAYIWLYLFQPNGAINNALTGVGLPAIRWLGSPDLAPWSLSITNIWFGTPFSMLMLGTALTTIDPQVKEAARVDGAGPWQTFRYVTWPLIAPFAALTLVLITMWTVNLFALPLAMTQGGPSYATTTTSLYMYRFAFEFGSFSVGSAIGVMLFIFNLASAALYVRLLGKKDR